MSQWTSGQGSEKSGGLMLPVPKLRVYPVLGTGQTVPIYLGYTTSPVMFDWPLHSRLQVLTTDIPLAFLEPEFDLKVEMMFYRRKRNSRSNPRVGNGYIKGWVHPAHGNQLSGWTRGGTHYDVSGVPVDMQFRPSEWPVMAVNQVIDVTQGPAGRFVVIDWASRLPQSMALDQDGLDIIPTSGHSLVHPQYAAAPKIQRLKIPVRVAFRYTIRDLSSEYPTDRISGPLSAEVTSHMRYTTFRPVLPTAAVPLPPPPTAKIPYSKSGYYAHTPLDATNISNARYIGLHFWFGGQHR